MDRSLAPPPFRADPFTPDASDGARVQFVKTLYHSQDDVLRPWEREVEDNVKMLAGLQWTVFSQSLGHYVDVTRWMDDAERRWRQRPVINRLMYWFMLTHARLTENPAIVSYQPATADEHDAQLAEVADPIGKYIWRCGQMTDVNDAMMAWLIAAGQAEILTTVDPNRGEWETWQGPAVLSLDTPQGPIERVIENAPYDAQGNPLVQLTGPDEYTETGAPHVERQGEIAFEVPCPLQVRGEWGPTLWPRKSWHSMLSFQRVAEVEARWGIKVAPETSGGSLAMSMELTRLMYGSGWFGAAGASLGSEGTAVNLREGRVPVYTLFQAPEATNEMMRETDESPGGRMIVVVGSKVAYDGPRPARFPNCSPIERFHFVNLPGRNTGTTPLEMLKPMQRSYNRGAAQLLEHRNLQANPMMVIDQLSGIKAKSITNKPGQMVYVNRRPNVPAMDYLNPPSMPADVWRLQEALKSEMQDLGNIEGAEGRIPAQDASGELVNQLRSNADRFLGPTLRRAPDGYARVMAAAFAWVPVIWPREKIITVSGEDQALQTIQLIPELFEYAHVNIVADVTSMLPETLSEKRQRVDMMYGNGLFGPPGSPSAILKYSEVAHMPSMQRALLPGGRDVIMARQENAKLAQGTPATEIPLFEWYDDEVHLMVLEQHMKGPEFLKHPPGIQLNFVIHRMMHLQRLQAQQAAQMQQQLALQAASAAAADPDASSAPAPAKKGASGSAKEAAA